jgi:hypothetical protein
VGSAARLGGPNCVAPLGFLDRFIVSGELVFSRRDLRIVEDLAVE